MERIDDPLTLALGRTPVSLESLRGVGASENDAGQRVGILVVDDDRELVDLLAFLMEQPGLTPLSPTEPVAALELFAKEDPTDAGVASNLNPGTGFGAHHR